MYLAYYYTKEPTEPIVEWEIVALSIIYFVSMILNITVLETINNAIKSGLFPKKIKQKYQLKRLFHVLGILFVISFLLQPFVNITPIEEISTVLMFIFATNIIQFNIYKSLTSIKDEKVILRDIFDLITEFSWAISDENVKEYLENEIFRICFLKDIEKFFKRLASMIKYYIYPDIKIDISKSDAYLFHLSLISKENELKMQFVKIINTLRTRKYYFFLQISIDSFKC